MKRPIRFGIAKRIERNIVSDTNTTSWCDKPTAVLTQHKGMITARRECLVKAPPAVVFRVFTELGGAQGWLYLNWVWRLRGIIDRMVGGVGLRRGCPDRQGVRVGDAVDFWRVEAVEPDRLLRLRADMKVPGKAWLQFEVHERNKDQARLVQTAFFVPDGVAGLVYWYALYPIHMPIFSGMIRKIGEKAEAQAVAQIPDLSSERRAP